MEEVIPQYFQSKKQLFWEKVLFHPSAELTWGGEALSFWSDFIPKACWSFRLMSPALSLLKEYVKLLK